MQNIREKLKLAVEQFWLVVNSDEMEVAIVMAFIPLLIILGFVSIFLDNEFVLFSLLVCSVASIILSYVSILKYEKEKNKLGKADEKDKEYYKTLKKTFVFFIVSLVIIFLIFRTMSKGTINNVSRGISAFSFALTLLATYYRNFEDIIKRNEAKNSTEVKEHNFN